MTSSVAEITSLLTEIASNIQSGLPLTSSTIPAISSLNQSLNLNEESNVRVLETTLSLMCFKSPQVLDSITEKLVETIVSVLCSSISCKVLRFQKEEFLKIGSLMSKYDCEEVIKACINVFEKLEGHGNLSNLLLRAVLKVAASSSCHQSVFPSPNILNVKPTYQKNTAFSRLHLLLPEEISSENYEIPSRLFLWYLEPLILKDDISGILSEYCKRPFLCLKKEMHERMAWRSIVLCLVLSPTMFIETRTLLHGWFLISGLVSILDLQIDIVSSVLDVLSRPMWWGLSMEVGSKLPFSQAYFPNQHQLFLTLAGSLSCESFLSLVDHIDKHVPYGGNHSRPISKQSSSKITMVDHKSTWALLMNFPVWFYFAATLLFFGKKCPNMKTQAHDREQHRVAAAKYLAWINSPVNNHYFDFLVDCFIQISTSLEKCSSDAHKVKAGSKKKLMKLRTHDKKDVMTAKEYDGRVIGLWIKEFHDCHTRYLKKIASESISAGTKSQKNLSHRQNSLFRRISLGILIACDNIDEEACELLLHYAATGAILSYGSKELNPLFRKMNGTEEAIEGARMVFTLFDVIEDMSDSLFETEEGAQEYICRLRGRTGMFLVKCIEKLLQLGTRGDVEQMPMLMDLQRRLLQWKNQSGEKIEGFKAFDEIVSSLNFKISSYGNV